MSIKTVRIIDPRIEAQPEPVYSVTVSPKQNQYYKIPQSGLSDSYITFNNLTTLGADRAYLDSFELEITARFRFQFASGTIGPKFDRITIESFPFNKCCEEVRVNINGGAFFSQPLSYLRAKERYWDERAINDSYGNVCPCHKPLLQNECAIEGLITSNGVDFKTIFEIATNGGLVGDLARPTRFGTFAKGFLPTAAGSLSATNNSILPRYTCDESVEFVVTWREPIFASPFSSKIDATYGRPLYNITSMDIAFNMQDLGNMIRIADTDLTNYEIHLESVQLCYQVETVPPSIKPPPATVVPYRRFVPYITDCKDSFDVTQNSRVTMTSGVYTLNEIPTAIWIFAAPVKALIQTNPTDKFTVNGTLTDGTYANNKLFAYMEHISISCANTTQILNTATPYDLYRIAKANGCQDDFNSWHRVDPFVEHPLQYPSGITINQLNQQLPLCGGAGSVLRLIPGTDIVLPEQDLIPGANANNIVFQVQADFTIPKCLGNYKDFALWILFEYVGVATITPGQCQITMNPLGNGAPMTNAPVVSAPAETSTLEGSGWLDKLKSVMGAVNSFAKKTGIVSKALNYVPGVGSALSSAAKSLGYGYNKRPRFDDVSGGAIMGMGDFV